MNATAETLPSHITSTDAADLRWYFSTGRRKIEGSSNFGAMLDRMQHYGVHAKPCVKCGGKRAVVDDDGKTISPEVVGSGFVWTSKQWRERENLQRLGLLTDAVRDAWNGDLTCPACKGRGVVAGRRGGTKGETMSIKKGGHSTQPDADTGGDGSLARLGYVSRLLDRLKSRSMSAFRVIEAFYSPDGGSEACLWHLTAAGKTMLRGNGAGIPERQFFENERNRQAEDPNTQRRLLFQAADQQATALRIEAIGVWCEVRG